MNNKSTILLVVLISIILFTNCNKEKDLNLYPTTSLNVSFKLKDYEKKVSNSKEEILSPNFKVSITIKGSDVPQRTIISSIAGNPNLGYNLVSPIEAPFNKPFSISITVKGDSTTWEGSQSNIILEESRLPLQTSLTLGISSIMDIDGNIYKTVQIGSQLWLASNLKVTHFRNGEPITYITDASQWQSVGEFSSSFCNLNNDINNVNQYGRLYKWRTISDVRGLCPSGWRVPTSADWVALSDYLGGATVAGGKMKATGTNFWLSPNIGDNSLGFSAYPSLSRGSDGVFDTQKGRTAMWWASDFVGTGISWVYYINNDNTALTLTTYQSSAGVAIRCIK